MRIRALLVLALPPLLVAAAAAQDAAPTGEGVYTSAEADRGKAVAELQCSGCHGSDLTGADAPALVGETFLQKWETRNVEGLFTKIRDTMPAGAVGSLSDDEKLDVVAYLLRQNGFREGPSSLLRNAEARARIPLGRRTGASALRTGSFVRVTGCLSQNPDREWILTNATEPQPAGTREAPTPAESAPPGTQTVRLLSVFPDPSPHKGHKMEASGLLVVNASGAAVNVLSLAMLATACGP